MSSYHKERVEDKRLLIMPTDLTKMFENGKLNQRFLSRIVNGISIQSIPIINPAIIEEKISLSNVIESKDTYLKADVFGADKSILIEVDFTEEDIIALDAAADQAAAIALLTTIIKSKNNLIYIGSAKSKFTNNVIDIYYSILDACFLVFPELTILGSTLPANAFEITLEFYKLAPLEVAGLQPELGFKAETKYRPMANMKPAFLNIASGIAEAKSDISTYSLLLQGLSTYSYNSEYMRKSDNGDVNMLKDTLVQLIVIETPTIDMLEKDKMTQQFIVQKSAISFGLQQISDVQNSKIAFPLFF